MFSRNNMKLIQLRNIFIYLFLGCFFFFPRFQTGFIAIAFFLTFFTGEFVHFKQLVLKNKVGVSFVLFFLITLLSMFWTSNVPQGWKGIEIKFSLLAFPIFFPLIFSNNRINKKVVVNVLTASAVVYALLSFSRALFLYSYSHNPEQFYNVDLGFRIFQDGPFVHPTYVSFYYLILVLIWGKKLIESNVSTLKLPIIGSMGLVILFIGFIFFSSSKAGILGLGIAIFYLLAFYAVKKKKVMQASLLFLGFLIVSLVGIYNSSLKLRFEQAYQELTKENSEPGSYLMSTGARIWIWKATSQIIQEHPVAGVGVGDIRDELTKKYKEIGIITIQDSGFDSHQQYLQTFASLGIIGLLSLLLIFFQFFKEGIRNRNFHLFGFGLLYLFFGFTESMLETQAGIVFFTFCALFFYSFKSSKTLKNE